MSSAFADPRLRPPSSADVSDAAGEVDDGKPSSVGGEQGREWLVDAYGCEAEALRSEATLRTLFQDIVSELALRPIGEPVFHVFPEPGGITGLLLLSESHLACHTFPETGFAAFNLYSCRPRPEWSWERRLSETLGARTVRVRVVDRSAVAPTGSGDDGTTETAP